MPALKTMDPFLVSLVSAVAFLTVLYIRCRLGGCRRKVAPESWWRRQVARLTDILGRLAMRVIEALVVAVAVGTATALGWVQWAISAVEFWIGSLGLPI